MAHVILGLLLIAPQSLYDLVKNFEAAVSLFYSASSGSIKRALDALLARGAIEVQSQQPGARGRKVYRVTPAGRAEFDAWMTGELTGSDLETAALSRLFFLGLLEEPERGPVLQRVVGRLRTDLAALESLDQHLAGVRFAPEHREIAHFQMATLQYGLASHRRALEWFSSFVEDAMVPPSPGNGDGDGDDDDGAS